MQKCSFIFLEGLQFDEAKIGTYEWTYHGSFQLVGFQRPTDQKDNNQPDKIVHCIAIYNRLTTRDPVLYLALHALRSARKAHRASSHTRLPLGPDHVAGASGRIA